MKRILLIAIVVMLSVLMFSCSDAEIASQNLSKEADMFRIYRRVVFYNGITDEYILMIEGYCSVEFFTDKFVVTVKDDNGEYKKHYLGRADNVFPFVEQLDSSSVSDKTYKVIFKPTAIVPNVELR